MNYVYRYEKQGKTPQKDAKINLERRTKKVSETEKRTGQKRLRKYRKTGRRVKILNKLMRFN